MCFWTRLDYIDVFGPAHQPVTNHIFSDCVPASQRPEWFTQLADGSWVLREDAFEEFIGRCFLNQLRRARTLSTDYKICTPPPPASSNLGHTYVCVCTGDNQHGYLPQWWFTHATGEHLQAIKIMNDHGIGSSSQKVREIFPWDMYAATSENFSKFWEASINVTVGAPRLTDEVWDQCHYDGRTFVQGVNLEKIDFLYHTFPPHKKYSIGADGKYNFHTDRPRLWQAPPTVDANGNEVFTGDKRSFVHIKGVCGVGKTYNNLYLIAHALAASHGFNNDYFNMLDSPVPSVDKKMLIVLPNLRLAQRCFENLAKLCHSQEMYPPPT